MANELDIRSVNTMSVKLNNQDGQTDKPAMTGKANPGDTKPPRDLGTPSGGVPMPEK